LSFGLKENPQDNDTEIVNEIAVIMLPTTLKFLAQSLTKLVEFMEKASGTEIPFDASKIAALEKAMSEATISSTASPPPS
jgi:hypothetical protein